MLMNIYSAPLLPGTIILLSSTSKCCDLRAKLLVACLVTPALWLNLSDSRNILIIHFGLLLKEHTLDSIGHDLWKNIKRSLLVMDDTLYFFVN